MSILPKELEEIIHKYNHQLKMNDVMTELKTYFHKCACCQEETITIECDCCDNPMCLACHDYFGGMCDDCQYEDYLDSKYDRD